ncbi:hypothetical protein BDV28DRAFT_145960 [Aspergillus coremiiformis]|uniref:Small secreted protein n=1 Tax=Aspergillus coremiiformis TaxID=138285 RepID=A0A5N6ZFG0_9EURO|nr:hypothetical protein BDV28DRAFT_145960 [Aspergillus coremiiformis]
MQLSIVTLLLSAAAPLTAAWNVTAYSNSDCTGYVTSLEGDKVYGCYWLTGVKDIKAMKASDVPEGWRFIAASGTGCDKFLLSGGDGCYTQGQGFQSFTLVGPS